MLFVGIGWWWAGAAFSITICLLAVLLSRWTAVLARGPLIASKHSWFLDVFVFTKAIRCSRFKPHSLLC